MKDNLVEEAMAKVAAAIDQVVEQGGVVHEDELWDANEAALDGASTEVIVETLSGKRTEPYVPRSRWRTR